MTRILKRWLSRTLPQPWVERLQDLRWSGLPVPFRIVRPHTMLSNLNLFFLQELAARTDRGHVAGDFVECGVYRGGSAGVLAYQALRSPELRHVWLYDTFTGTPPASIQDDEFLHAMRGQMVGSEAQTRRILQRLEVPEERVRIIPGLIEETLPKASPSRVALLHIDCNLFHPVLVSLETLFPRIAPGGFVVLNDYGRYRGCREATDTFLAKAAVTVQLLPIDSEAWYFQKPGGGRSDHPGQASI